MINAVEIPQNVSDLLTSMIKAEERGDPKFPQACFKWDSDIIFELRELAAVKEHGSTKFVCGNKYFISLVVNYNERWSCYHGTLVPDNMMIGIVET